MGYTLLRDDLITPLGELDKDLRVTELRVLRLQVGFGHAPCAAAGTAGVDLDLVG